MAENSRIGLIGYSYGGSANISGCQDGPRVLRSRGLVDKLNLLDGIVKDYGDVEPALSDAEQKTIEDSAGAEELQANNLASTFDACRRLREKTTQILSDGLVPFILGGDHSLSMGSVSAVRDFYAHKGMEIGLIWIDTHPDVNTPGTSPSKNLFGMPCAFLLGLVPGILSELTFHRPAISPHNLVYVGLRDVDPGERESIRKAGITAFTMKDIDIHGAAAVLKNAAAVASKNTAGFAVSFDLDVCDPRISPGTGTPIRGGLTYREAHLLLELLHEDGRALAWEFVELNPSLDKGFTTADLAVSLILSAAGKSIL